VQSDAQRTGPFRADHEHRRVGTFHRDDRDMGDVHEQDVGRREAPTPARAGSRGNGWKHPWRPPEPGAILEPTCTGRDPDVRCARAATTREQRAATRARRPRVPPSLRPLRVRDRQLPGTAAMPDVPEAVLGTGTVAAVHPGAGLAADGDAPGCPSPGGWFGASGRGRKDAGSPPWSRHAAAASMRAWGERVANG